MRLKSRKFEWLEIMQTRGNLTVEEQQDLRRLQKGRQGEIEFDQMFEQILGSKVEFLDDIEIEFEGNRMQMDKVFASGNVLGFIDIKNYSGEYVYENNTLKIGSRRLAEDCFEQARRSRRIGEQLLAFHGMPMRIVSVLVFINENGNVRINQEVPEIVLNYAEIPQWLLKLKRQARMPVVKHWQKMLACHQPQRYEINASCSPERFAKLKKGICCSKCHGFDLTLTRFHLSCKRCGQIEVKKTAYYRTIKEYGIILHHLPLQRKELVKFFGENYSPNSIKDVLLEYFTPLDLKIKDGRYINDGKSFSETVSEHPQIFEKLQKRLHWKSS